MWLVRTRKGQKRTFLSGRDMSAVSPDADFEK
jgi:hypothetical protein